MKNLESIIDNDLLISNNETNLVWFNSNLTRRRTLIASSKYICILARLFFFSLARWLPTLTTIVCYMLSTEDRYVCLCKSTENVFQHLSDLPSNIDSRRWETTELLRQFWFLHWLSNESKRQIEENEHSWESRQNMQREKQQQNENFYEKYFADDNENYKRELK